MNFNEFLMAGWDDHGDDPEGVMKRFPKGIEDNTGAVFVELDAEGLLRLFALMRFSAVK